MVEIKVEISDETLAILKQLTERYELACPLDPVPVDLYSVEAFASAFIKSGCQYMLKFKFQN